MPALPSAIILFRQEICFDFSLALFSTGRSIPARIAMIAITMRSSIRVKIRIFTLRRKNIEQGTRKEEGGKHLNNWTLEQFNNGKKKGETRLDRNWLRPLWETAPCRELRQISVLETKSWRGTRSVRSWKTFSSWHNSEFRFRLTLCVKRFSCSQYNRAWQNHWHYGTQRTLLSTIVLERGIRVEYCQEKISGIFYYRWNFSGLDSKRCFPVVEESKEALIVAIMTAFNLFCLRWFIDTSCFQGRKGTWFLRIFHNGHNYSQYALGYCLIDGGEWLGNLLCFQISSAFSGADEQRWNPGGRQFGRFSAWVLP